jgi:colanic acid/amylovoran biosynthesis glycosyltransferase
VLNADTDSRPVVASYCATFLKPEMLHIYRQIVSLRRVQSIVITQKRENAGLFPFERLTIVKKPATHFLRRIWHKQLLDGPWQISQSEAAALTRLLNIEDAQLLHIYFGHIAVHLLPLIRWWPRPSIVSFHGADVMVDMNKRAYRQVTTEMLSGVRRVLVRSESLRRAVIRLGCDERKIEILRTGIPLDQFPFRERVVPRNGAWRLVQACRLIEKKGLAVTLRAFAIFKKQYPQAVLEIAGEGPLLPSLKRLAAELNLADSVRFRGFLSQEDLRELFYASHIFLHPSETGADGNQEGIPNSMLEAMATGLPVFATEHGGIPEAIESGVNGVLVPEGDFDQLAGKLLKAVRNTESLGSIALAGSNRVAREFDQGTQGRRLEEIYLENMRP